MNIIEGGITSATGFSVGSTACGIKKSKKDITLLYSEYDCIVAGAFTQNVVRAAPVMWDEHIVHQHNTVRALVVNSGNANACTGTQGEQDTKEMALVAATSVGVKQEEVLVCSTGVIGVPLPMQNIRQGIKECSINLKSSVEAGTSSAEAILTTDTFTKEIAVTVEVGNTTVTIGAMAKGSGMIHPNMATMLSFCTTDANVDRSYLQQLVSKSVQESYNMISVDGDTSTNDTVLVFANGASNSPLITKESEYAPLFEEAFRYLHRELAKQIIQDGEGASKLIELQIKGAASLEDARVMAKSAISSNLVKTAFFGSDANWGRLVCAMGYSGAFFDLAHVTLTYISHAGMVVVLKEGEPINFNEELAKKILDEKEIIVSLVVGDGPGEATAWGCDLSYEYVRINGEYRS